jgi:hypothetical protein
VVFYDQDALPAHVLSLKSPFNSVKGGPL